MLPICYSVTSYKEDFNSLANLKRTNFATSFFDNCIKLLGCLGGTHEHHPTPTGIYLAVEHLKSFKALTSLRSLQKKLKNLQAK